ncbi:hypothetical protein [Thiocystis violacea]|uniref:hypothetical protein n=1 Tax=Thiocystis violacea TaxID=13725 RepID=UPI001A924747|nr:hypothetical protein [Thiocystis violacea]
MLRHPLTIAFIPAKLLGDLKVRLVQPLQVQSGKLHRQRLMACHENRRRQVIEAFRAVSAGVAATGHVSVVAATLDDFVRRWLILRPVERAATRMRIH